jgi:hypothetical protein
MNKLSSVPKEFRRSVVPNILVLHRAELKPSEVQEMHGVRVTRPLRTITDLLKDRSTERHQLKLAFDEALRRGLIVKKEIAQMPHNALERSVLELAGQMV